MYGFLIVGPLSEWWCCSGVVGATGIAIYVWDLRSRTTWEERRAQAKAFKGNQHISAPSPFVNSQNTTRELAKSLKVSSDTASQ
jgi:hypothetical protein